MALRIYGQGDFVPDPGGNEREYPIPEYADPDLSEIVYDKKTQQLSYLTANLVGVFTDWFTSFFEPNYFKMVRIRTQSTVREFKSFMRDIYKRDKPFLVIDPHQVEISEDSIFAQNMLNRYNMIDPEHDNIGMKLMYSLRVMESDMFKLVYRRNQYRMEFDTMIMEQSLNRQTDTWNMMVMHMRHNSKFMLYRKVPMLIPFRYIINIARFHGYDWKSQEFLDFLNSISQYPIIKRSIPAGQTMFYMEYDLHIQVESPGLPSKDTPEMAEAIEWGARIVDSFIFRANMPGEFVFLTKKEYVGKFDRGVPEDPDAVTFISPLMADLPWPKELKNEHGEGSYKITNRADIELQEGDETRFPILHLIKDYSTDIYSAIMEYVEHKLPIDDIVKVRVYPNGSMKNIGAVLHNNGDLELMSPTMNKLYTVNIYVNHELINQTRDGKFKKFIGTIEQY